MPPKNDMTDGIFHLPVEITVGTARGVLEHALDAMRAGETQVLDFSGVQQLDSSALAVLFSCQREEKKLGISLHYVDFPTNLQALAKLYGVDGFFVDHS